MQLRSRDAAAADWLHEGWCCRIALLIMVMGSVAGMSTAGMEGLAPHHTKQALGMWKGWLFV